jgi:hypothetical protein
LGQRFAFALYLDGLVHVELGRERMVRDERVSSANIPSGLKFGGNAAAG